MMPLESGDTFDPKGKAEDRIEQLIASAANLSPAELPQWVRDLAVRCSQAERQIEELRASQQLLEQSRDRFEHLNDYSPVGYVTLDSRGSIRHSNVTAATMLEIERGRLSGKRLSRFVVPEDRHCLKDHLARCRTAAQDVITQLRLLGTKGRGIFVELRSIAGNVPEFGQSYRTAITDITEHKRTEAALRRCHEQLRLFIESTPLAVMEWGPDLRLSQWSTEAERLFGWKAEEVLGKHVDEFRWLHEEDAQHVNQVVTELAQGARSSAIIQNRNYRKDGSIVQCEWYNSALTDEAGTLRSILSLALDVTERRRAEQQRQYFVSLVENSHEFIGMCDMQFRPFFANKAGMRMVGLESLEQALQTPVGEFFFPEDQPFIMEEFFPRVLRDGHGEVEIRFRHFATGEAIWMIYTVFPLTDAAGKPTGFATVSRDITERKQAEEQLQSLNDNLEQRVQERTSESQWRANQLQQLAAQITQAEEGERRRLSQVLHDTLQQLLVAAKIRLGRAASKTRDASVTTAINEARQLLEEAIGESRSLTKELSPPILYDAGLAISLEWLGRETEKKYQLPVTVRADPTVDPQEVATKVFVFQSARELILNAIKHANASSLTVSLSHASDQRLQLVVEDDGKGFNVEAITRKERGGFGLFSIRERLNMLGGELQITSTPHQGTKATILVPFRPSQHPERPVRTAGEKQSVSPEASVPVHQIRVLLADDHPALRKGLADALGEHSDLNVVGEVGDGQEAVDKALIMHPDVILMDIAMPRMDGIEATRQIKETMPEICVIGLSMHESEEMAAAMRHAGASDYLTKTVSIEDMISAILKACWRRQ